MKRFGISGLGRLLILGGAMFALSAPAVSDDYLLLLKDPSLSPPNDEVGVGTFSVTNYPSLSPSGDAVDISVVFDAVTGLPDYFGDDALNVFATASSLGIGDGQCTAFDKEGECIAWVDGSNCPDASDPTCDKSVGEGSGPSRVYQVVSTGILEDPEPGDGSRLLLIQSGDADGTGHWIVLGALPDWSPTQGTYHIRNTVPEPPLALLLLAGGVPLLLTRRAAKRRARG